MNFKVKYLEVLVLVFSIIKKGFKFQIGCLFHGCDTCFEINTFNPVLQTMNSTLLRRTKKKMAFLKETYPDFEIIEIWEHYWDKLCKEDVKLKEFLESYETTIPIEPRDSLYGGRTNALKLYHNCAPNEKIFYFDFCSLYPAVMKYGVYPLGHPKIISERFDYSKKYFGIIKCSILPPKSLYLPVLPLNINKKLIFTLCYTCASEQINNFNCTHSTKERALNGTWVSLEIDKAIEMGYKLIKYEQIWEFDDQIQYDKVNQKGGLFTDYVNFNLKGKAETSGYPDYCTTDDLKDKYVQEYFDEEGIKLEKDKIEKNPGARADFKIKLNSLWGFFALNCDKTLFKILYNIEELDHLMSDDRYIIQNIDFSDGNFIQVSYSIKKELNFGSNYTNVITASFVTCQARLKLYDELEKLGRNVLYFDTGLY